MIDDIKDDIQDNLLEEEKNKNFIILNINNNNEEKNPIDLDKSELVEKGYDKDLIDKIYKNAFPVNIKEALDFLKKNDDNKFTHLYMETSSGKCAICEKDKSSHTNDFKPEYNRNDTLKLSNKYYNYDRSLYENFNCGICEEKISHLDVNKIKTSCKHYFCLDCWQEYLKEKITNGKVIKIKCMEHECTHILDEKFIKKIIESDENLLKKYEKFLSSKKLLDSNKKIKFCPHPDCDGYAEKKTSKYVECNYGHKFCFVCGEKPHGWKACSKMIDKGFEEWKTNHLVKRCPYCKYWTEKTDGCNHMTCSQCNFQWCWICEKECVVGHYLFGTCKGLHFSNIDSNKDARSLLCHNFGLFCCLSWIIMKIAFLLAYLTLSPYFLLYVLTKKGLDNDTSYDSSDFNDKFYKIFFFISFIPFFICYEVIFICYIAVFSIPAIIIWPYYRFLRYIFFGKLFGRLFAVGDDEP